MVFAALVLATAMQASPNNYLADVVAEMRKQWPGNRMVEIVCHGHSVPAGYFKTPDIKTLDAYPHLLKEGLCKRFPNAVINVTVTAIGGEDSISGEKRFARDVLARHPDIVTIDYGLNDRRRDPGQVKAAWKSMISQAKMANIKVILLTPTGDTSAKMDDANDPIVQQAVAIRLLAKEESVGLVDSFEEYSKAIASGTKLTDLMSQVNHPNRKGHELVATKLLEWFPNSGH